MLHVRRKKKPSLSCDWKARRFSWLILRLRVPSEPLRSLNGLRERKEFKIIFLESLKPSWPRFGELSGVVKKTNRP
jgi:hypothetical protein